MVWTSLQYVPHLLMNNQDSLFGYAWITRVVLEPHSTSFSEQLCVLYISRAEPVECTRVRIFICNPNYDIGKAPMWREGP